MSGWAVISLMGITAVLLPNLYILMSLFKAPNSNWQHIQQYLLKDYLFETIWLVGWSSILTVVIGLLLAWLVAAYDFPLKRFFRWAFILPLAFPPYIAAYTYSSMLSYTGFVQVFLRNQMGIAPDQKYFNIMSMNGAIFIFTMFLFPYVYMMTKVFLERQSASLIENARLLGKNSFQIFVQVVLPVSRAAIISGVSLVIFEVLNDYGVTHYFGIQTFTNAIFRTWFGMYDIESAMRLAALLMMGIIALLVLERVLRQRLRFDMRRNRALKPIRLRGFSALGAVLFCSLIFAFSFLVPFVQLVVWAFWTYDQVLNDRFVQLLQNTLFISSIAAACIMFFATVMANVTRANRSLGSAVLSRVIAMGYSIPGAVVAIGVLAVFLALDVQLAEVYRMLGTSTQLVLSLSWVMLAVAYVIRFLAVGYGSVEVGFEKIGNRYHEASRLLGFGFTRSFFKVDLPLIKGAILTGTIMSFLEIIKELPLTLLLRPFNFDTLATKTYQYASDEQIHQAAIPALLIIGVSLIAVFIYHRLGESR